MTVTDVLNELKKAGNEGIKKILLKHGAKEPFFGVKVEDIKKIQKKIKTDQQAIALELFASGNGDAQYLAGLMADGSKMNKKDLQIWVKQAEWSMISEFSVPWVASENKDAFDIAVEWIASKKENIASAGWATLSSVVATWPDEKLNISALKKLLLTVPKDIHTAPNRVRSCMNNFVIAVGAYVKELSTDAMEVGKKTGVVTVENKGTACKVPFAPEYIKKALARNPTRKKKMTAKC